MHSVAKAVFRFCVVFAVKMIIIHRRFQCPKARRVYPQFCVITLAGKGGKRDIDRFVVGYRRVIVCGKGKDGMLQFAADGIADKIAVFMLFIVGENIAAEKEFAVCAAVENTGICAAVNILPAIGAKLPAKGIIIGIGKSADEIDADIALAPADTALEVNINLAHGGEVVANRLFRLCRQGVVNRRKQAHLLFLIKIGKTAAAFRRAVLYDKARHRG